MSKPNINIPTEFAINGDKTDFSQAKITNGFDRLQPDVLPGDNLNKFIDDTYKGLNGVLELYEGCVLYDSTVTYNNTSIVFYINADDEVEVYRSLINDNLNNPLTDDTAWEKVELTDLDNKADVDLSNINASASAKNTINGWGMPDYSAGVSWSTSGGSTWTAPYDCFISAMMDQNCRFWVRKDNNSGIVLNSLYVTMAQSGANTFPVPKGTVLYVEDFLLNYSGNVTIYPLKGAS